MNERLINGFKYGLVITLLLLIYMILLIVTNMIPSNILEKNIKESADTLVKQGELRKIDLKYKEEYIFNFSDALMLNMAYSVDSKKPFDAMLLSRKDYISGVTEEENTTATENIGADPRFIESSTGDVAHTKELKQLMYHKDIKESYEYARYWHGYMIVLRPLLALLNISQIRILFTIIILALSVALVFLLYKKLNLLTAIIFLIGLFSCSVFMVGQSLSEIPVFVVALTTSIILLIKKDVNKNVGLIFLISGSIIGFTDLLTEPLIDVLLPLTVYFLVAQKQGKMTISEVIKKYIFLCTVWIIGYALTWISKWIILDLIKHRGIFSQAMKQVATRSTDERITYYRLIKKLVKVISVNVICATTIIPIALMAVYSAIRAIRRKNTVNSELNLVPFIINITIPFIWFFVIRNHSFIHTFFSYKLLMLSIINVLIIFSYILSLYRVKTYELS